MFKYIFKNFLIIKQLSKLVTCCVICSFTITGLRRHITSCYWSVSSLLNPQSLISFHWDNNLNQFHFQQLPHYNVIALTSITSTSATTPTTLISCSMSISCSSSNSSTCSSNLDSANLIWNLQVQHGPLSLSHSLDPRDTHHQHVHNQQRQVRRTQQAVQRQDYKKFVSCKVLHTALKLDLPKL